MVSLAGPQDDSSIRAVAPVHRVRLRRRFAGRSRGVQRQLGRLQSTVDAIIVVHSESWATFRPYLAPDPPSLWVDLQNVNSCWQWTLGHHDQARQQAALEADLWDHADQVSVCTRQEAERLLHGPPALLTPGSRHPEILRNGVDASEWRIEPIPADQPVLKLFGGWTWRPNHDGLEWFLEQVWPHVRSATTARCVIAGTGAEQAGLVDGVEVVGRLDRLDKFAADAWAIAAPIRHGVGGPVKIAEALATGIPTVTTVDGDVHPGLHLASDDPKEWIAALTRLLTPPSSAPMTAPERRAVADRLSWAAVTEPLLGWLRQV